VTSWRNDREVSFTYVYQSSYYISWLTTYILRIVTTTHLCVI